MPVGHIWKFDLEQCGDNMILGTNEIFQKIELSLSCSNFSRKPKISEIRDQNDRIIESPNGSDQKLYFQVKTHFFRLEFNNSKLLQLYPIISMLESLFKLITPILECADM